MPNTNTADMTVAEFAELVAALARNVPSLAQAKAILNDLGESGTTRLLIYRRAVRAKFYTDEGV